MNVHFHLSPGLRANSYLIGPEGGGDAILVDPGEMDSQLLRLIEGNGYYVRSMLVTHPHSAQVHGVKTLLKIYAAGLYGNADHLYDCPCHRLTDGEGISLCNFKVEVMALTSEALGPLVYRIENLLFTGTLLTAGNLLGFGDRRRRAMIAEQIDRRLLSLGDDVLVLPGSGPPSSVRAERFLRQQADQ